jgi:hypothetical protein
VDCFMELHNVLEICCSWKSQKLLHVDLLIASSNSLQHSLAYRGDIWK